jgi:cytidylate kinase
VVVAIDGPGGVGKSTAARAVAAVLGFEHLDTGATYRAATLAALRAGADPGDKNAVLAAVSRARIAYEAGVVFLDGEPVSEEARADDVNAAVSDVSAHAEVRELVVAMQRAWVDERGGRAVVEGRDIGTVVFPEAEVKVFITASPEVRAARRAGDAESADKAVSDIEADLRRRDHIDSTREASPLTPALDAVVIDTSEMGIEEVRDAILTLVAEAEGRRGA